MTTGSDDADDKRHLRPFLYWLAVFYSTWLTIVVCGNYWSVLASHWPISATMALGSYVAGSTPMGGGTVGFPVLVLLFDLPGSLGRNFALAIQSIGMVSASIYIYANRSPVAWCVLRPALCGSLIGTPLGAALIAPFVPDIWVKLTFAVVWCSFGMMHLIKLRELTSIHGTVIEPHPWNRPVGIAVGLAGGILSSITGVGIDMLIYAMLVLLFREDLKIAIPTSVIIMAFTSVVGIISNLILGTINPQQYAVDAEVFANWLAAAPVVALGAPLGACIVNLISRKPTLVFVSILCIAQFVWTILHEQIRGQSLILSLIGLGVTNLIFHALYKTGLRIQRQRIDQRRRPAVAEQVANVAG